ncbi:MAG TPA: DUF4870 domain-containing protein [Pyrinomonadaceae bacterium]|jgi:uncharacterized membrane protein|nr:DUF4870 domain-containing protein [Pyrinomonadaceae bacterium]
METKKSKYDTNPLDPDVERKAEEAWGERGSAPTQQVGGATREVGDSANEDARKNIYSEAPTRRYDNPPLEAPYPSVFVPPTYSPPQYQPRQNVYQRPVETASTRSVVGIGLPEKWALVLPYMPFFIGVVPALLELFLVPRNEVKVRFHAAQALSLHIAILIAQTLFSVIGSVAGSSLGGTLFNVAAFIFLIISMIRVGRGDAHRIAPLAEPAQWFNEHIEPRNRS